MENKEIFYEVWALGYTVDGDATEFDRYLGGEFKDPNEAIEHAKKFKDASYVLSADEMYYLREEGTDYIEIGVEACFEDTYEDGEPFTECEDVIYEVALPLPTIEDIINLPDFTLLEEAEEEDVEELTPEERAELVFQLYKEMKRAESLNPLSTLGARMTRANEIKATLPDEGSDIAKTQTASNMMWKEFEGYDAERRALQEQIDRLTNPVMPVVVQVVEDNEGFNVLIEDKAIGFEAWLDVWDSPCDEDWGVNWNQYIFYLTDVSDIFQKCCQENDNMAEWCIDLAIDAVNNIVNKKD